MLKAQPEARALAWLARREYSFQELVTKLERSGVSADLAQSIVVKLAQQDLQSDQRFTEALIAQRIRRGYGPMRIEAELRQRGINKDVALKHLQNEMDWANIAAQALDKRFGPDGLENHAQRPAQWRFLMNRGFGRDVIRGLLGQLG